MNIPIVPQNHSPTAIITMVASKPKHLSPSELGTKEQSVPFTSSPITQFKAIVNLPSQLGLHLLIRPLHTRPQPNIHRHRLVLRLACFAKSMLLPLLSVSTSLPHNHLSRSWHGQWRDVVSTARTWRLHLGKNAGSGLFDCQC